MLARGSPSRLLCVITSVMTSLSRPLCKMGRGLLNQATHGVTSTQSSWRSPAPPLKATESLLFLKLLHSQLRAN